MSRAARKDPVCLRSLRDTLFWIGLAFAVASLTLVALSNTALIRRLERMSVPPSWVLAGAAVGVLFAAEQCNSAALDAEQEPSAPLPEPEPEPEHALPVAAAQS